MKYHRVRVCRYLLTSSWEVWCYNCSFKEIRQYWIFALCAGLRHYDFWEQDRMLEGQKAEFD